jgi:hypothetical protein
VTTLVRWFQKELFAGIRYRGMILISKESLAEWLASDRGQSIQQQSTTHQELIEEFQIQEIEQKNSGMGFGSMSL